MKPHEVANLIGVDSSTIRNWSREYADFFSAQAAGGEGRHRSFTDLDVRLVFYISQLKRSNFTKDEIALALQQVRADSWETLPPLPDSQPSARVPVVPAAAADAALESERRSLMREIAMLQDRIEKMEGSARSDRETILELTRRLATAEAELRLWQDGRLRRD
jgi:DNA-binding transcriptional MerR regulator